VRKKTDGKTGLLFVEPKQELWVSRDGSRSFRRARGFIADFGTMGYNIIMGNGHVGLGDMIDKWAGGPIIKMYDGLY